MTLADCPHCGRRELRGSSAVHLAHTHRGAVFALTCRRCGAELGVPSNRMLRAPQQASVA